MPEPTKAQTMVAALEEFLSSNAGVQQVMVDGGTMVTYNRRQAMEELKYWQRQLDVEQGRRRRRVRLDLSGF